MTSTSAPAPAPATPTAPGGPDRPRRAAAARTGGQPIPTLTGDYADALAPLVRIAQPADADRITPESIATGLDRLGDPGLLIGWLASRDPSGPGSVAATFADSHAAWVRIRRAAAQVQYPTINDVLPHEAQVTSFAAYTETMQHAAYRIEIARIEKANADYRARRAVGTRQQTATTRRRRTAGGGAPAPCRCRRPGRSRSAPASLAAAAA